MPNQINRIRYFTGAQPNIRVYGISNLVADLSMPFEVNPHRVSFQDATSHTTRKAIEQLAKVHGITHLRVEAFAIHITLAQVFSWSEKHNEVVKILKDVYFATIPWNGEYDMAQEVEVVSEGVAGLCNRCIAMMKPVDIAPDADR
jgi:hypothetical protein